MRNYLLLLPFAAFLFSCGTATSTPDGSEPIQRFVQPGSEYRDSDIIWPAGMTFTDAQPAPLTAQINESATCYTFTDYATTQGCTPQQRDLVNYAGSVFTRAKVGLTAEERRMTIGATYVRGNPVITVNGGASANAKAAVRQAAAESRWGYLAASTYDHAETALYKAFGGGEGFNPKRDIGITNPSGPCDACKNALGSAPVAVTYYLNYYF